MCISEARKAQVSAATLVISGIPGCIIYRLFWSLFIHPCHSTPRKKRCANKSSAPTTAGPHGGAAAVTSRLYISRRAFVVLGDSLIQIYRLWPVSRKARDALASTYPYLVDRGCTRWRRVTRIRKGRRKLELSWSSRPKGENLRRRGDHEAKTRGTTWLIRPEESQERSTVQRNASTVHTHSLSSLEEMQMHDASVIILQRPPRGPRGPRGGHACRLAPCCGVAEDGAHVLERLYRD